MSGRSNKRMSAAKSSAVRGEKSAGNVSGRSRSMEDYNSRNPVATRPGGAPLGTGRAIHQGNQSINIIDKDTSSMLAAGARSSSAHSQLNVDSAIDCNDLHGIRCEYGNTSQETKVTDHVSTSEPGFSQRAKGPEQISNFDNFPYVDNINDDRSVDQFRPVAPSDRNIQTPTLKGVPNPQSTPMDTSSHTQLPIKRPDDCTFAVHDIVKATCFDDPLYGRVRWIGKIPGERFFRAAIVLECDIPNYLQDIICNGIYRDRFILCSSDRKNILVVRLTDCEFLISTSKSPPLTNDGKEKVYKDLNVSSTHPGRLPLPSLSAHTIPKADTVPTTVAKDLKPKVAAVDDEFYPSRRPDDSPIQIGSYVIFRADNARGVVRWIGLLEDELYYAAVELNDYERFKYECTYGTVGRKKLCSSQYKNIFVTCLTDMELDESPTEHLPNKYQTGDTTTLDGFHPTVVPEHSLVGIGSVVRLRKKPNVTGVVRWIGLFDGFPDTYKAAVELDDTSDPDLELFCTNGVYDGKRLCSSSQKNIFVVDLKEVQPFDPLDEQSPQKPQSPEKPTARLNLGDVVCVGNYDNVIGKVRWMGITQVGRGNRGTRVALEISDAEMKTFRYPQYCTYGTYERQKLCFSNKKNILIVEPRDCHLLTERSMHPKQPTRSGIENDRGGGEIAIESKIPADLTYSIGDIVKTDHNPERVGTVKWIGFVPRFSFCAAVELLDVADSDPDCCSGVFCGYRLCYSSKRNIYVIRVENCKLLDEPQKEAQREESPEIIGGEIKPILDYKVLGVHKGIQGEHNSCYMDASLFSMFAFNSFFDICMLSDSASPGPASSGKKELYRQIKNTLHFMIVNPLRRNGYVRSIAVQKLRRLLDDVGLVTGLKTEEKDPEELMNLLLINVFNVKPFINLSNGQSMHTFHLMADGDNKVPFPTVRKLLEYTFNQERLKLAQVPDCMILHLPRFGKEFQLYKHVFPNDELDITDLLQIARKCNVCGDNATKECEHCFQASETHEMKDGTFCDGCVEIMHKRSERSYHNKIRPIGNTAGVPMSAASARVKLNLSAVLCIERSHYVAFVRTNINGPLKKWVFFDSMSDRQGDQNIPKVEEATDLDLSPENHENLRRKIDHYGVHTLPSLTKRLIKDAYICIYIHPETRQFQ